MVLVEQNNIRLRTLVSSDLNWLFEVENNKEFWEVSGTTTPFSKTLLKAYIANADEAIEIAKQFRFVIEYKKQAVGLIDLFDFDSQDLKAGVGVLVTKDYQNKGIASNALEQLINYSFNTLGLQKLFATIAEDNENSIKLFEKQKFQLVEVKKDWIEYNNVLKNELHYQLLNI